MLIGVGLGPGDKELLTLKAVRLLCSADRVFVPGRMAYELVKEHCHPVVLEFPMVNDEDVIRQALERNAELIAPVAMGGIAVLGILGDPNFYSTFSRQCEILKERHPGIEFAVEPGISSITAFASRMKVPVNSGFQVTDGSENECLVLLKVRSPREVMKGSPPLRRTTLRPDKASSTMMRLMPSCLTLWWPPSLPTSMSLASGRAWPSSSGLASWS